MSLQENNHSCSNLCCSIEKWITNPVSVVSHRPVDGSRTKSEGSWRNYLVRWKKNNELSDKTNSVWFKRLPHACSVAERALPDRLISTRGRGRGRGRRHTLKSIEKKMLSFWLWHKQVSQAMETDKSLWVFTSGQVRTNQGSIIRNINRVVSCHDELVGNLCTIGWHWQGVCWRWWAER